MSYALNISIVFTVLLLTFSGCADTSGASEVTADIEGDNVLMFYNHETQNQYLFNSEQNSTIDLNSDTSSNLYMKDKEPGRLLFWPDEYEEGALQEKVVMLKMFYDFERDGNITADDFIYLGHFHDGTVTAQRAQEFSQTPLSDENKATLSRLNSYLAQQTKFKQKIKAALNAQREQLCNFLVPYHIMHDDNGSANTYTEVLHYALSTRGKLYVFEEKESNLVKKQGSLALDGVPACIADENGMSAKTDGLFVFSRISQKLYLVDAHGSDFHVHSNWPIRDILPGSVMMQMVGFGSSD